MAPFLEIRGHIISMLPNVLAMFVILAIGIATNQTVFSWIAIGFVLISLITGGRWLRKR